MNRYSLAVVLLLTTVIYTPAVQAKPVSVTAVTRSSVSQKLTPFSLVSLAYQGHYRKQGINSYSRMFADSNDGRISAKKLVQAAINAGDLPAKTLKDRGFMTAVAANLDAFEVPNSP